MATWQSLLDENDWLMFNSQAWPELLGGTLNWDLDINPLTPAINFGYQLLHQALARCNQSNLQRGEDSHGVARDRWRVAGGWGRQKVVASDLVQVGKWARVVTQFKTGALATLASALYAAIKQWVPGQVYHDVRNSALLNIAHADPNPESAVAFAGGEGLFTISMKTTSLQTSASASTSSITIKSGTETKADDAAIAETKIETTSGGAANQDVGITSQYDTTNGNTLTIYLGDPDVGDLFNVLIRQDTTFGRYNNAIPPSSFS